MFIAATNMHTTQMTINAHNIADLSETDYHPTPDLVSPLYSQRATPTPTQATFQDPAILSMARAAPAPNTPSRVPEETAPQPAPPRQPGVLHGVDLQGSGRKPQTNILDGMKGLGLEPKAPATPDTNKKRPRRNNKSRGQNNFDENNAPQGSPVPAHKNHGKGWRQTPILQSTASFQPFKSLKTGGKGQKIFTENGWASEDVTEEMGEFDFENNLAKFDKRTIFDQMRRDDEIDDADRLVSHNRKPKPGTAGGKNLHYSENVLDTPTVAAPAADFWNSEADVDGEHDERPGGRDPRNGSNQAMRRTDSKSGPSRRSQSRKASTVVGGQPMARVNSTTRGTVLPSRRSTPRSGHRSAERPQHQNQQPGLYLFPSQRRVEAISTLQMLNLENIAANELGFSEGLMAENAGRGIAEVAITAMSDPALKVRYELAAAADGSSSSSGSTIVILAGNNKSSIRALAAGRHLRNKNYDVVVCLVGVEREKDLLEDLRRQVQLYRSFGGKVLNKNDFFEHLRQSSTSGGGGSSGGGVTVGGVSTSGSVALIIDTLLGLTISFEELRVGDQANVYELMEWANRNEAFVLAVDVPSGIDPTSGKEAIIDGGQLFVKPRYVAAIGAPKKGLLETVVSHAEGAGEAHEEWKMYVVDLGLGNAVWRKAGAKVRKGVDFGGGWVAEMRYVGVEAEEEED